MRIEDRSAAETAIRESRSQAAQKSAATEGVAGGSSLTQPVRAEGDQLQLSTLGGRIRGAFESMGRQHAARVDQITAEVRAGRYQVDVGRLSRAMLDEAGLA